MKNPSKNKLILSNDAFTLMELMISIAIIAIMSAIAIPNLLNPENKLKKAARDLMGDMQKTRSMAIKTNKEWAIVFEPTNNRYFIISDKSNDGNDNNWLIIDSDGSQPVEKTVNFSGYAAGVQYGHGGATKDVSGNVAFPTYTGDVLSFNSKGMVNTTVSGTGELFVYIQYGEGTYAVGTGPTGVVKILRWDGGALTWQ